jgi:predicted acylesterase/phospholipase RssA
MGACIGAQCALGWDYVTMLERNRDCWIRSHPLRDYTIPLVSLLTGKRMVRALTMMFGDTRIEDLPTSYFCVSSDLVRGEPVVHRDGLLRKYVRASSSVAGIAPPVPDRGSLLVDGGVLNNLPADVMRKLHGGTVIAIDVNPYGYGSLTVSRDYGESLSAWQILWSRLNPFAPTLRVPNIQAILERVTMLGGIRQANELLNGAVDLYIRPPTDEFGFLEMHKLDTIADIGYRFASVEIEAWKSHVTA